MKTYTYRFAAIAILLFTCSFLPQYAVAQATQKHVDQKLYNTILHMDSVCFDAYNNHDLETLKKAFSPNLEFYHDLGGLSNYEQNIEAFQRIFVENKVSGMKRELVKNSLEVYPIKDYGAIEVGVHRFTHMENGKQVVGLMKFLHVWQYKNNEWKITRIVSYDH
jgi:hypothetical protein